MRRTLFTSSLRPFTCMINRSFLFLLTVVSIVFVIVRCSDDRELVSVGDTTPPAAVGDLTVLSTTESAVILSWTATGDDSTVGTAVLYDLRYSTQAESLSFWWDSLCVAVENLPPPKEASKTEIMSVGELTPGTTCRFGLKVSDESSNLSALSNIATAIIDSVPAVGDTIPPAKVPYIYLDRRQVSTVLLVWIAPGDDGVTGTASRYDIRHSPTHITEENWAEASPFDHVPFPGQPGTLDTLVVEGIEIGANFYVALKTADEVPNWSELSYVAAFSSSDSIPPEPVTDLTVQSIGSSTITLNWTATGDDGFEGLASVYELRHSHSMITEENWEHARRVGWLPAQVPPGGAESYQVVGLVSGASYYFGLVVYDDSYNRSPLSNIVMVTTESDTIPPTTIADLAFVSSSLENITIGWTAPGDDGMTGTATEYEIRYSPDVINDESWETAEAVSSPPLPELAGAEQIFTIAGLEHGSLYHIGIMTSDEVPNWSGISNIVAATSDTTPPARITSLTARRSDPRSITLTWTAPGDDGSARNAAEYSIRYSTTILDEQSWEGADRISGLPQPSTPGAMDSITVSDLMIATTYNFAVKTADEVPNWSALSNVVSALTYYPRTWQVPQDAPTIQAGMDSAQSGDTVLVACGTYFEHEIRIKSGTYLLSETGDPDCVVIDAQSQGEVLICDMLDTPARIKGFTVTGGLRPGGYSLPVSGLLCHRSDVEVNNCDFVENEGGSAILCEWGDVYIHNCNVIDNMSGGVTVRGLHGQAVIETCTISLNSSTGVANYGEGSDVVLRNCTIAMNGGNGFNEESGGPSSLWRTIIAFNGARAIHCSLYENWDTCMFAISDCNFYGNAEGDWHGTYDALEGRYCRFNNISEDPLFCDPEFGDFRLDSNSPCLNAPGGLTGAWGEGCSGAPPPPSGELWRVPSDAPSIAAAIDSSISGDTIRIDCGTYYEHDIYIPWGVVLESETGDPDCVTIDAQGQGRIVLGERAGSCFDTLRIEGITFRNGHAPGLSAPDNQGGAMYLRDSMGARFVNCQFMENQADHAGGALFLTGMEDAVFTDCNFQSNRSGHKGGRSVFCGPGLLSFNDATSTITKVRIRVEGSPPPNQTEPTRIARLPGIPPAISAAGFGVRIRSSMSITAPSSPTAPTVAPVWPRTIVTIESPIPSSHIPWKATASTTGISINKTRRLPIICPV